MSLAALAHKHTFLEPSLYARCVCCDMTLRGYIEWLERLAVAISEINYLTETSPVLASLIAEARKIAIGSAFPYAA